MVVLLGDDYPRMVGMCCNGDYFKERWKQLYQWAFARWSKRSCHSYWGCALPFAWWQQNLLILRIFVIAQQVKGGLDRVRRGASHVAWMLNQVHKPSVNNGQRKNSQLTRGFHGIVHSMRSVDLLPLGCWMMPQMDHEKFVELSYFLKLLSPRQ